ncbi:MAG: phospholipase C, phosphocholine-specific [Bacteroidota bacterium]
MDSRREFIRKAALLSGMGGLASVLPPSIARAFEINPAAGTTFLDAEHVVILMQENRSFDHCYGTLNGVRGFNDPRAIRLPNGKPVWYQTNEKGQTYAPFRLNIKETNATWMGSLPHGWTDQTDARNNGRCDQWLVAKKSGHKEYKEMPLTMGFYTREDVPFYYSLADAFTICDQNFCSSLTGTTPNRLHLWTGKIREDVKSQARVRNEETDYDAEAQWKTFPERLEENGVSWKVYQNEISVGGVLQGEHDEWLANFTDNPLEWFSQYNVRFNKGYIDSLPGKIEGLKKKIETDSSDKLKKELDQLLKDQQLYTVENWNKLTALQKNIHQKAFTTNINDPGGYHELVDVKYDDNGTAREMKLPKGDVLYQFRKDVNEGTLPTVSWLVAPGNFSDHPGSPWYGAWYLSESIDILTKNPEVWKKTIFILCYDENDGYFDHVAPFTPPKEQADEFETLEMDLKRKPADYARGGAIGLGYRVPLVIASPWSRGGAVNSQVYDHTSILMFLEKFLSQKTGKNIKETNISEWRRTVCGDLTSVFKPYNGETMKMPEFVKKTEFVESIYNAKFKNVPVMPQPMNKMPSQEKGTRPSNALPYELHVSGVLDNNKKSFSITMESRGVAGAPFIAYVIGKEWATRSYAVKAGGSVKDMFDLSLFENGKYHIRIDGPNGFMREYKGSANDPVIVDLGYAKTKNGDVAINIISNSNVQSLEIIDNAYGQKPQTMSLGKTTIISNTVDLSKTSGWYDLTVRVSDLEFRFAGRVETGKESITDPALDSHVS